MTDIQVYTHNELGSIRVLDAPLRRLGAYSPLPLDRRPQIMALVKTGKSACT